MKIALIIPSTSKDRDWKSFKDSYLLQMTLKTFFTTFDKEHEYIFYIGIDRGDPIYDNSEQQYQFKRFVSIMKNTSIQFVYMDDITKGHLTKMWNVLFKRAYDDNCDYYYQCGDDIEFKTAGWINASIEKLNRNNDIGMTGPVNNNSRLLTQSFVSRKHMDLFGYYFPEEIMNWFCDDWINEIYKKIGHFFPLNNHLSINMGGNPRYNINNDANFEKNYAVNFIETKKYCLSLVERDYKLIYNKFLSMIPIVTTNIDTNVITNVMSDTNTPTNTAFICGCVYNCGKYLPDVFENIKQLVLLFDDFRIIISYDKSDDDSLLLLKKYKNENWLNKMIIIENQPELLTQIRTQNISNARNSILSFIRNNDFKSNIMIMMDMDDVCSSPIKTSIVEETLARDDWDCISFNRSDYYDIWALSIDSYIASCWHWDLPTKVVDIMKFYIMNLLDNIDNKNKLIECYSAFNGFAMYRLDKFINCSYDWKINKNIEEFIGQEKLLSNYATLKTIIDEPIAFHPERFNGSDCEHRFFHMEAIRKNGARIRISPQYILNPPIQSSIKSVKTIAIANKTVSTVVKKKSLSNKLIKQIFKHTFYINLESRVDRDIHVKNELKKMKINASRFNAIKMNSGALGCSMSHLKCIQIAKENDWDHVCILEDDIEFLDPQLFKRQLGKFLKTHTDWDVLLLAGNNMLPYQPIDETCIKVSNCQTTTGYIVKKHYYDTLIENYKKGIDLYMKNQDKPHMYSIDRYWFLLQNKDNWLLLVPLTVIQREDYSDIQGKNTNFRRYMLDYNKVVVSK